MYKEKKWYLKSMWYRVTIMMITLVVWAIFMPLTASAANVTTGKIGENEGAAWTYDADTDTLVLTGQISGVGKLNNNFPNAKKIILEDCTLVGDVSFIFAGLSQVESMEFKKVDTSQVTSMSNMFKGCTNLKNLDVSGFDTANVKNMGSMFSGCVSVETLDVSNFDTGKVTNMGSMFSDCASVSVLDVSGFITEGVTSISFMFKGCSSVKSLDLSSFDISHVKYLSNMFEGCEELENLNIGNFNTSQVQKMTSMFSGCRSLKTLDVRSFNTENVSSMYEMFSGCAGLTKLDLSNFNTSNVTTMYNMFNGCSNLTSLDLSNFDMSNVGTSYPMLQGCRKIKTIKTPKAMRKNDQIHLPDNYYDAEGKKYTDIYSDGCNITLVRESSPFADVSENSWQYEYAKFALNKNMMTGKGTNAEGLIIFDPNAPMTRAEFVQTLYNKEGKPAVTYTDKFPDVAEGKWYTNAILWAAENNIVAGKGNGNFDVSGNITRQEMATILYKYANYKQYNTVGRSNLDNYTDASSVSSWAVENMKWALSYGVMKGKGDRLAPLENATRAECATMLCNFMSYYEGY